MHNCSRCKCKTNILIHKNGEGICQSCMCKSLPRTESSVNQCSCCGEYKKAVLKNGDYVCRSCIPLLQSFDEFFEEVM